MIHLLDLMIFVAVLAGIGWGMARATRFATRSPRLSPDLARVLRGTPVLGYGAVCAMMVSGVAVEPTSNNLWPVVVFFMASLWLVYALAVALALGLLGLWLRQR